MTSDIKIGLVIMASGLGKRFGGNKLMEVVDGKPLIKWIIDTTEGLYDRRVVVTRSDSVKALCDSLNIDCIKHDFPNRNDTVRLGLSAIMDEATYCFFVPGDQPLISRDTLTKMIYEAKQNQDMIIRASYSDTVGSPVGFPKILFDQLLSLPEGKGGSVVVKNNENIVKMVETENEYELWDVDTVADLEKIKCFIGR